MNDYTIEVTVTGKNQVRERVYKDYGATEIATMQTAAEKAEPTKYKIGSFVTVERTAEDPFRNMHFQMETPVEFYDTIKLGDTLKLTLSK
jgi:hypothetical protein